MIFFHDIDPFTFPNLGITMINLFRAATLEDWTDIMYFNVYGCKKWGNYSAVTGGMACESERYAPSLPWHCA